MAAACLLVSCQREAEAPKAPAAEVVTLQGRTMGTTYTVKVVARSPDESQRAVAMQKPIDALLEEVNDQMSTYREGSEISRFNRHRSDAPFPVSPETAYVVRRALEIGALTEGAFDITLAPLIRLWGFDAGERRDAPPPMEEIEAARARTGLGLVTVEGSALKKARPDVEINLSGIAKGHGADRVLELVARAGFFDVMVEIGGEVRAQGKNARGEPWRIGINVPRSDADPTAVLVAVPVEDRALATSGDYRNFFESGGKRYAHILDPVTGRPVERTLVSASILAPDCATADALATAAIVLGEERARAAIAKLPGVEALFVHKEGEELKVSRTDGFPAPDEPL